MFNIWPDILQNRETMELSEVQASLDAWKNNIHVEKK